MALKAIKWAKRLVASDEGKKFVDDHALKAWVLDAGTSLFGLQRVPIFTIKILEYDHHRGHKAGL